MRSVVKASLVLITGIALTSTGLILLTEVNGMIILIAIGGLVTFAGFWAFVVAVIHSVIK